VGKYTQANRALAITTPLGPDALLLEKITGTEAISELFRFNVDVLAEKGTAVPFEGLLGQPVNMVIRRRDGVPVRYFGGIVSRVTQGPRVHGPEKDLFTRFELEVVPQLWLLTRNRQFRIFQSLSVPDILKKTLHEVWQMGADDVSFAGIQGTYYPRDYCVQYNESDFAFVSRLMEEEGIYYFFKHTDQGHQMILADDSRHHPDLPTHGTLHYEEQTTERAQPEQVYQWLNPRLSGPAR
jgi:type VI secretion system secreted protein VgrG